MRLNSTIITFVVAFSTIWLTVTSGNVGWEILVGLLGIAMGSKAMQKFAEVKELKDISNEVSKKPKEIKLDGTKTTQQISQPYYGGYMYYQNPPNINPITPIQTNSTEKDPLI